MDRAEYVTIVDADGVRGRAPSSALSSALEDEERAYVWVELDEERVRVPVELLVLETEGRYRLPVGLSTLETAAASTEQVVVPVVEETISIRTEERETGRVLIEKTVHEEEEVIDVPLTTSEVEVRRVAVGRLVDEPVSERREGDTLILPVLEEVLVVEKKLRLKEEIHITTKQTTREQTERVTLRKEEVSVERVKPDGDTL